MEDMDVYSVVLWNLRKDVELSYLANDLVQFDRRAPQAWCAVGNCFSLSQEHDTAVKCLQRAISLDPGFTYAYSLCAAEYGAEEEVEKAMSMHQMAVRIDRRHYKSWYDSPYFFSFFLIIGRVQKS